MKETSLNVDAEHWWGSIIGGCQSANHHVGCDRARKSNIYPRAGWVVGIRREAARWTCPRGGVGARMRERCRGVRKNSSPSRTEVGPLARSPRP